MCRNINLKMNGENMPSVLKIIVDFSQVASKDFFYKRKDSTIAEN